MGVVQLVERSLPIPEVRGSNPVNCVLKRRKERNRGREGPIFFLKNKTGGQQCDGYSSVDSSAPTILLSQVQIRSTRLCFHSLILYFICHCIKKTT